MTEEIMTKALNEKANDSHLEEKTEKKKAMAKGNMTVCCGIPMGLKLVRNNGQAVVLAGMPLSHIVSAKDGNFLPAGKFGLTVLEASVWEELYKKYKDFDFMKNGTVFAKPSHEEAVEKAVEKSKEHLGFEQIDPKSSKKTRKAKSED